MKHNHNHKCVCEHESVKFCKHCNTIYCEGCNQEWTAKPAYAWTYSNPWYGSGYAGGAGLGQAIPLSKGPSTTDNIAVGGHTLTVSNACNHGDHI